MNIYILEITNYAGKSGFSKTWNSRFYLPDPAKQRKVSTWLRHPCRHLVVWGPGGLVPGPGTIPCAHEMQRKVRGWGQEDNSHETRLYLQRCPRELRLNQHKTSKLYKAKKKKGSSFLLKHSSFFAV